MKRYWINFDKMVNELIPHYMGGRKLILYLQSTLKPLQQLSDSFSEWANEMRIEASMTSQVFKLEWFLNRKFDKYFTNPNDRIFITNKQEIGLAMYNQLSDNTQTDNAKFYQQIETNESPMYRSGEKTDDNTVSFVVVSPRPNPNLIDDTIYQRMLSFQIDKYRLAGKTYIIKYSN